MRVGCVLLIGLFLPGCGKGTFNSRSRTDWTINGHRTITKTVNGMTRKVEMTADVQIENGQVTKFPKGAVISLQESGTEKRQAELRENEGKLELWIQENGGSRKGTPEDDAWLQRFLGDVMNP